MKRKKKGAAKTRGRIPLNEYTERIINASLVEDIGSGDITTEAIVPENKKGRARIVAKQRAVVAGLLVAEKIFKTLDDTIGFKRHLNDGDVVKKGDVIATVSGRLKNILTAERVALNFLQRLSGVATTTREYIKKTKGLPVKILDTRKTTPCMRIMERYAVQIGGGFNHRFGLFDAILIKDNHIKVAGGVEEAIGRVRARYPKGTSIEVEVRTLKEVREALKADADIIMLDNMGIDRIKKALKLIDGRAFVEVSGGVTLDNVARIARTGVDYISVGALTHSVRAVDMSLEVE